MFVSKRPCFVIDIENSSQTFVPHVLHLDDYASMPPVHIFCREDHAEDVKKRYSTLSRFIEVHANAGSLPQSADTELSFWLGEKASQFSEIFLVAGSDARYESLEVLLKKKYPNITIKRIRGDHFGISTLLLSHVQHYL